MNNQEYWEKRKAQQMYDYMDDAEKKSEELMKIYMSASSQMQAQAKKVFNKYQSKYGLTQKDAEKLLSQVKDPEDIRQLIKALKADPENSDLVKELESQAYGSRINRINSLFNQMSTIALAIAAEENARIQQLLIDLADKAYYHNVFNLQQYSGYAFDFKMLDRKNIEKILNTKWYGENFSDRIWKNADELAKAVKQEVMLNLLTGRPLKDATDAINTKFASGYNNARRLVRTESAYTANQMQMQAYDNCDVKKYIYVAILDLRTSAICRSLDKKIFNVDSAAVGVNYPPMHPWCRSTTIAYMSKDLLHKLKQTALDPVTGKHVRVPGDMTYQEWYEKYVKGKQIEAVDKSNTNLSLDKIQYQKYKEIFGDEIPENVEKFRKMKYNDVEKWKRIKAEKQSRISEMDFADMQGLVGKLGDREVREWYKFHDESIPAAIDTNKPIVEQARQACELRNTYRTQARDLMKNQTKRKQLDIDRPNISFEELILKKMESKHLTYDQAVLDVYRTSTKTNVEVNNKLGVE